MIPWSCLGHHDPKAGDQVSRCNGLASGMLILSCSSAMGLPAHWHEPSANAPRRPGRLWRKPDLRQLLAQSGRWRSTAKEATSETLCGLN